MAGPVVGGMVAGVPVIAVGFSQRTRCTSLSPRGNLVPYCSELLITGQTLTWSLITKVYYKLDEEVLVPGKCSLPRLR